jgi:excisionase family DNA binding protein
MKGPSERGGAGSECWGLLKKAGQKTVSFDIGNMASRVRASIPRIALTRAEAAEALGISLDSFERHAQPELRLVRRGRMRLVPVRELERWLEANSDTPLADRTGER